MPPPAEPRAETPNIELSAAASSSAGAGQPFPPGAPNVVVVSDNGAEQMSMDGATLRPGERVFEDNTPALGNGFTITAHLDAPLYSAARWDDLW